jgi:hypothetical protein
MGFYVKNRLEDLSTPSLVSPYITFHRFFGVSFNGDNVTPFLAQQFARFCDQAIRDYNEARVQFEEFFATHDSIAVGSLMLAKGYFESCVINIHMALRYLSVISKSPHVSQKVKSKMARDMKLALRYQKSIKNFRDAVLHSEEYILSNSGQINTDRILKIEGGTVKKGDDMIRTFDHLRIEDHTLTFSEMISAIRRIHSLANKMKDIGLE